MNEINRDIKITFSGRMDGRFSMAVFENFQMLYEAHSPVIGEAQYINTWLFTVLKPVFLQMPFKRVELGSDQYRGDLSLPEVRKLNEFCSSLCNHMNAVLRTTNILIAKNAALKNVVKERNHDVVLFHAMEGDYRLIGFYNHHKDRFERKAILKTYESGWNGDTHTWDKRPQVMAPDAFIRYVVDNKVFRMITINYFEPEEFLTGHNVHFPAVVHFLGLEWFGIELDTQEMIPFPAIEMFHIQSSTRFAAHPMIERYWFEKAQVNNVNCNPTIQHYDEA